MPSIVLCVLLLVCAVVIYAAAMVFTINHFGDADLSHPLFTLAFITVACILAFGLVAGQAIHTTASHAAIIPFFSIIAAAFLFYAAIRLAGMIGNHWQLSYAVRCLIFAVLSFLPLALDAYLCAIRNPPLFQ